MSEHNSQIVIKVDRSYYLKAKVSLYSFYIIALIGFSVVGIVNRLIESVWIVVFGTGYFYYFMSDKKRRWSIEYRLNNRALEVLDYNGYLVRYSLEGIISMEFFKNDLTLHISYMNGDKAKVPFNNDKYEIVRKQINSIIESEQ